MLTSRDHIPCYQLRHVIQITLLVPLAEYSRMLILVRFMALGMPPRRHDGQPDKWSLRLLRSEVGYLLSGVSSMFTLNITLALQTHSHTCASSPPGKLGGTSRRTPALVPGASDRLEGSGLQPLGYGMGDVNGTLHALLFIRWIYMLCYAYRYPATYRIRLGLNGVLESRTNIEI